MDILRAINRRRTPQNQPADPRQEANSAGGFTFALDDAARLRRFLTLGVDGGTDCAQPMLYALANRIEVDTFVVYTDNETWHGDVHPHQALRQYRERTGIPARLVVVGMTATEFSIADPADPGMLDIAGFDAAVPSLISQFARSL